MAEVKNEACQSCSALADQIDRYRLALKMIMELGGVDKPGGSTIMLSASSDLQMRALAREALK
jgi:hypothetical protein